MKSEKNETLQQSMRSSGNVSNMLIGAMRYSMLSILMMTVLKISMNLNLPIEEINSRALSGGDPKSTMELTRQIGRKDAAAYGEK